MVRDGLVFKDEDGQVIFNQYSFCELVKHLLVELVGISYEEASQIVERSPLAAPVANVMGVAIFSHDLPYYRKGADGKPEIDPEEAETVRRIYRRYLDGCSLSQIQQELEADHVPTA